MGLVLFRNAVFILQLQSVRFCPKKTEFMFKNCRDEEKGLKNTKKPGQFVSVGSSFPLKGKQSLTALVKFFQVQI